MCEHRSRTGAMLTPATRDVKSGAHIADQCSVADDLGMSESTPPRTPRERARAGFMADLLAAARARVRQDGAAELSLRAVARDLGVASSAVYRYVDSRDALLTLLIIEAFDAAGSACENAAAEAQARGAEPAQVWLAVARAFRSWALG